MCSGIIALFWLLFSLMFFSENKTIGYKFFCYSWNNYNGNSNKYPTMAYPHTKSGIPKHPLACRQRQRFSKLIQWHQCLLVSILWCLLSFDWHRCSFFLSFTADDVVSIETSGGKQWTSIWIEFVMRIENRNKCKIGNIEFTWKWKERNIFAFK